MTSTHTPSLADIAQSIKDIQATMATKDDLRQLATKEELNNLVTKEELKDLATKQALKNLATKGGLKSLATKDGLKSLATKGDLKGLATKEELRNTEEALERSMVMLEARLTTTVKREAGDLGESIGGLATMVAKEFDSLSVG